MNREAETNITAGKIYNALTSSNQYLIRFIQNNSFNVPIIPQ